MGTSQSMRIPSRTSLLNSVMSAPLTSCVARPLYHRGRVGSSRVTLGQGWYDPTMTTRASRRALLFGLAAAALGPPRLSNAQTAGRIRRIVLFTGTPATKESVVAGLRDLGWGEGQNIVIETRVGEAIEGTVLQTELRD